MVELDPDEMRAVVNRGLKQCLTESGGQGSVDIQAMEKLFLSLA